MSTTTAPAQTGGAGVQSTAAATSAADLSSPDALESFAAGLMDRISESDARTHDSVSGEELPQAEPAAAGTEPAASETAAPETAAPQAAAEGDAPERKPDAGGEEYPSLEAYLQAQKLDPESFRQLPVTIKVDGREEAVPLAEVIAGYQLKSASYNRMNELAQERTAFQGEQAQVRQALGLQIQRTDALLKLAQEQLLGDYSGYTPQVLAQLRADNPGEFAAVMQSYEARRGAIAQALQQVDAARQEQAQVADNQRRASVPVEQAKLLAARPEWRDPAKASAAQAAMRSLGTKLGFTDAELNGIYDHRYMLVLDMAARYAQLQASQSATVRRVRAAPRMVNPGTRTGPVNPRVAGYQQTLERALKNPSNTDALAAAFANF